jgi:site-specific recombinase XerD
MTVKLEEQLKNAIRLKHYSYRTEESYVGWYRRYVLWHGKRHPAEMGTAEVEAFLTHLAVNRGLAAVSQNQALNALLFLYREVLKIELEDINAKRAKHHKRLPVVLTSEETAALLQGVKGDAGHVCKLLYGCGLRLAEALTLRIKDVDFKGGTVAVRGGKGDSRDEWRESRQTEQSEARRGPEPRGGSGINDRILTLPKSMRQPLTEHQARIKQLHEADRREGLAGVALPQAMAVKHPAAAESWEWFWLFPGNQPSTDPRSGIHRRHHLHDVNISRELARSSKLAGITKRVTAHSLRHSFATHLILRGVDIRSIQELLGHANVRTTEIYTQLAKAMRGEITSPLDDL